MQPRHLGVLVVLLAVVAVPTAAVTVSERAAPDDEVTGAGTKVTITPGAGSNGQYATINDDGRIELDFDRLNDEAVTRADDVFTVAASGNRSAVVWVTSRVEGVTFYRTDPAGDAFTRSNALTLEPNESVDVGVEIDTHGEVPTSDTFTVHAAPVPQGESKIVVTQVSTPETVTVNQTSRIDLTVVNVGDRAGNRTVVVDLGGTVVFKQDVRLEPGESRTFSVEWTFHESRTYPITVAGTEVGVVSVTGQVTPTDRTLPSSINTTAAGTWALWFGMLVGAGRYRRKGIRVLLGWFP